MTQAVPIAYGPWEPDKAAFQSSSLTDALNVAPVPGGYGPMYDFQRSPELTLQFPIKGGAVLSDTSAQTFVYAGSNDDIYVSNGVSFTSVYSSPIPIASFYRWQFVRFVGKTIAIEPQIVPVAGDIGSAMTALTGGPPIARVGGVVGDFLVLGDLIDGVDGPRRNRIRWSGFRNPNAWGTNVGTQADFNDMPDEGGSIQGVIGREFGTVFQRYSISRMTYVGGDTVFQFDTVEKKRGAISSGSIIDAGLVAFYIADDGFMIWDGTNSTSIGSERVNNWFRNILYPRSEDQIVGVFDPLEQTVFWAFPTDDTGILKHRIVYSIQENRWSHSDLQASWLMTGFDIGYTLEQMDSFGNLQTIGVSFDDPRLLGGRFRSVGFDPSGIYGSLTGDTLAGIIETGDWQSAPGSRAFVNAVRPQVNAATVTCSAGVRSQTLSDQIIYTPESGKGLDGRCPMRASGRFMRFRTSVSGQQAWTHATGIEAYVAAEGRR